jgi:hypothetical protein
VVRAAEDRPHAPATRAERLPVAASMPALAAAAPLLVAASAVAVWLAYDVGIRQIALFAGYEAAYVALPGIAVHILLRPGAPWREQLAYGWALGYALEVGAYAVAAELGIRSAFNAYPLAAVALLAALAYRRRIPTLRRWTAWSWGPAALGAGVSILTLVYLGLDYFARAKLPWRVDEAVYNQDLSLHLSLAAEAQNHWPIKDPSVAGEPFFYHLGVDVHFAAVADVTGLPLPLILFRLAIVPMTLVFIACMCVAGRSLFDSRWVGPVAAGLAMLVGDADVDPGRWPFLGLFFTGFWISPSFLLGIAIFIPAVAIVAARLADDRRLRDGAGDWVAVAILLTACMWAKASAVPVLLGGLGIYVVVRRVITHRFDRNALAALSIASCVFLAFHLAIYRHAAVGLGFDPPGTLRVMPRAFWLRYEFAQWGLPSALGWVISAVVGVLGLLGPALAGIPMLVWLARRSFGPVRTLFASMLLVGVAAAFFLAQPGGSQLFFTHCGFAVGCFLSAEGLGLLAVRSGPEVKKTLGAAAFFAAGWIALVIVAARTPLNMAVWSVGQFGDDHFGDYGWRDVLAIVLFAAALALWWRALRSRAPTALLAVTALALLLIVVVGVAVREQMLYSFTEADVAYGFIASAFVLLGVLAAARTKRRRGFLWLIAVAAVTTGALAFPLDRIPGVARATDRHAFPGSPNVDRGLYDGLVWIRDHTPTNVVLAVDNYDRVSGTYRFPIFVEYAAFAERRVFLEGWRFSTRSWKIGASESLLVRKIPFPERLRLNEAVFVRGDKRALRTLVERYGVRYLVRDIHHGHTRTQLLRLGRLVFSNPSVAIYRAGPQGSRPGA